MSGEQLPETAADDVNAIAAAGSSPEAVENQRTVGSNSNSVGNSNNNSHGSSRKERLHRACTARSAARLNQPAPVVDRRVGAGKKEKAEQQAQQQQQCSKIVTPLVSEPPPSQLPRWQLRSMWELASLLNFLHIFRPLLNIPVEFTAEELETALITPNNTLDDIHIPLLKAIPPVTRMALGRATWVTVLCRKLRDWWHWVAEGELPIVASHGTEVETYKTLDPGIRVVILKALCDIRVEQEDIRNFIDDNLKHGLQLSVFRKERVGGDSHGLSFWYEDDPLYGHRLYREIRKFEIKKVKARGVLSLPAVSCQWETVATNLDEFQDVSEKLFSSKNRFECALGKRLKNDMLPEIEKIHKKKERLLKKQHRQALLLDNFLSADGIAAGRSLRDRKPVTYTFDDFDRSINEAIKITKRKQPSPEPVVRREILSRSDASSNGRLNGRSNISQHMPYDEPSPKSTDSEEMLDYKSGPLDRSNRRRQRPQRYSEKDFVEAVSDNEADFDSDDDIVGEAIYDEEYLKSRKRRKVSSSSEGDEEYRWEEEEPEDEEEENFLSSSEDNEEPQRSKKLPSRSSRRETKLRSVDEIQSGLRRSRRATRNRINYRQYEMSDSEADSTKPEKSSPSEVARSDGSNEATYSSSQYSQGNEEEDEPEEKVVDQQILEYSDAVEKEEPSQQLPPEKASSPGEEEAENLGKRRFLDLNELAPGNGFDDGPGAELRDDDTDNF